MNNTNDNIDNQEKLNSESAFLNNYIKQAQEGRQEQSLFVKSLIVMVVLFVGVLFAIFLFADNKAFLESEFGKDSVITKIFMKLTQSRTNKEKAEFSLPFGPRKQNILLLGVDSNGAEVDLWVGTRPEKQNIKCNFNSS